MVRLTDRPDMTLDVYRGHKTTTQTQQLKEPERLVHGPRFQIISEGYQVPTGFFSLCILTVHVQAPSEWVC